MHKASELKAALVRLPGRYNPGGESLSPASVFQAWFNDFWSRRVTVETGLRNRRALEVLIERLLRASGEMFEASRHTAATGLSRQSVANYVGALSRLGIVHVVRPFHTGRPEEILHAPRVYAVETGLLAVVKGWDPPGDSDFGRLWVHRVLNDLVKGVGADRLRYWSDKRGHAVEFALYLGAAAGLLLPLWRAEAMDERSLGVFRRAYPQGPTWAVAADVSGRFYQRVAGVRVEFLGPNEFSARLPGLAQAAS